MNSLLLLLLLFTSQSIFGQEHTHTWNFSERTFILYSDSAEIDLSGSLAILNEEEQKYSAEEITSGNYDSLFVRTNDLTPTTGAYHQYFWVKIKLRANIDRNTRWILKTDKQYAEVNCYLTSSDWLPNVQKSGWSLPPSKRSLEDPDNIFDVPLKGNSGAAIYLHIHTNLRWSSVDNIKISLIPETVWNNVKMKNYTFLCVYAGICLLASFYWVFTYRHSPKTNYIYLILATLSALVFCLDLYGITAVIWTNFPLYQLVKYGQHYLWLPLMVISHFAISYKANSFVTHFSRNIRIAYWITCYLTIVLLLLLPLFMQWKYSHAIGLVMILFSMVVGVILISYLLMKQGFRSTGFAFLAILPIFIGMGSYILLSLDLISEKFRIVTPIGALTTVIMYFYGMAYYVRALIEKRNGELHKNDILIREQNIVLEKTVKERTAELKTANEELYVAMHDLKETHSQLLEVEQVKLNERMNTLLKEQELRSVTHMMAVQEQERKRIATDLHDRLGSMLSTVKLYFGAVEEQIETPSESNRDQYGKAYALLDEACDEVRKISHDLVSGELTKFGLTSALRQMAKTIQETGRLEVKVLEFGLDKRLESSAEIALYRIVQELMNNILKHSRALEVIIQLNKTPANLNILVEDNGIGFDIQVAKEKGGMGLQNIETRVNNLQGTIVFDSGKGRGTTIIIDIPA